MYKIGDKVSLDVIGKPNKDQESRYYVTEKMIQSQNDYPDKIFTITEIIPAQGTFVYRLQGHGSSIAFAKCWLKPALNKDELLLKQLTGI